MVPSSEHVMKKRHHTRRRIRFGALILVTFALIVLLRGTVGAALSGDAYEVIFSVPWVAALGVTGVLLFCTDRLLARLLVPIPSDRCPRCRYRLTALARPTCPECGLPVSVSFVSAEALPVNTPDSETGPTGGAAVTNTAAIDDEA